VEYQYGYAAQRDREAYRKAFGASTERRGGAEVDADGPVEAVERLLQPRPVKGLASILMP